MQWHAILFLEKKKKRKGYRDDFEPTDQRKQPMKIEREKQKKHRRDEGKKWTEQTKKKARQKKKQKWKNTKGKEKINLEKS